MSRSWLRAVAAAFLVLAALGGTASAAAGPAGPPKDPALARIGLDLAALHQEYLAHRATAGPGVAFRPTHPRMAVLADRVLVDAVALGDDPAPLLADLLALGLQQPAVAGRLVSGQLPIGAVPSLPGLVSLRFVRPALMARRAGLVTSQGDRAMRADVARAAIQVTGQGVPVGVLSDSFNCQGGAADDVAAGDLTAVQVLEEEPGCESGTDEGRGMLQIVHDVAPGSPLLFATAFTGQAGFAANISALTAAGARVIVDDVIYFAEPMFQDGVIAQAVDAAVAAGTAYFSAAGNEARMAYASEFRDGPMLGAGAFPANSPYFFFGGVAHDFDPGPGVAIFQDITLQAGRSVDISFQWADRYASVSGSPGAATDLDLYVLDETGSVILIGLTLSEVGLDPVVLLNLLAGDAADVHLKLLITRFAGPAPALMKYVVQGGLGRQGVRFTIDTFDTRSGTLFGHANAAGAEAVGAAAYDRTPEFGACPPVLEPFSSAGTTPILFTTSGMPTSDPRALKPGLVAPDGVNTTFFGVDVESDGRPNFFGTSAAAPHAAAVAALLRQAHPGLTPVQVYGRLRSTALDFGPPGFDADHGFGLVQADAALVEGEGMPPDSHGVLWPAPNSAGWHRSDTALTLVATRRTGSAEVAEIHFALEGAQTGSGVAAGPCATLPITAEGRTTVTHFAVNALAQAEPSQVLTVQIDRTPPALTCDIVSPVLGTGRHALRTVPTSVEVIDGLSGSDGFRLMSVVSSQPDQGSDPGDQPGDIEGWAVGTPDLVGRFRAETSGGPREYRLTYEGRDVAGNTAQCELVVEVRNPAGAGRVNGGPARSRGALGDGWRRWEKGGAPAGAGR